MKSSEVKRDYSSSATRAGLNPTAQMRVGIGAIGAPALRQWRRMGRDFFCRVRFRKLAQALYCHRPGGLPAHWRTIPSKIGQALRHVGCPNDSAVSLELN